MRGSEDRMKESAGPHVAPGPQVAPPSAPDLELGGTKRSLQGSRAEGSRDNETTGSSKGSEGGSDIAVTHLSLLPTRVCVCVCVCVSVCVEGKYSLCCILTYLKPNFVFIKATNGVEN